MSVQKRNILIFSDLHLDNYRRFSTISNGGVNSRLLSQINVVGQVKRLAKKLKPEAIVFLGDLFNGQGATINKLLYLMGNNLVYSLQEEFPVYLIVGNHDIYVNTHILTPMAGMPNVRIVESTVDESLIGRRITMVPWCGVIPRGGDVLLGHLDIDGVKTGIGYELPGTIHQKEVAQYNTVISGHYHTYQTLPPNIVYCGAVMPISFGDVADEDYGCLILDEDLKFTRSIIDSPKFIPIIINTQQNIDKFAKNRGNNYYRLTITDRKIVVPKFDHMVEVEWDVQEEMKARLDYEIDDPLEDILCKYIDQCNTQINKEEAKLVLRGIMGEC
uniref:Putative calcineurin-like phosphoesterase n=1 Tax=viral metagenome TaxID=1070528 RepID=A0A6M3IUG5_9ZZZZ